MKKAKSIPKKSSGRAALFFASLPLMLMLAGCFTGIESTKKINITREDRKLLTLTEEDTFLNKIHGQPLAEWNTGKQFIVSDGRISLLFDRSGGYHEHSDTSGMTGRHLAFKGISHRRLPDASEETVLLLSDETNEFRLPTGKSPLESRYGVQSSDIPMLIDLDMVKDADRLLTGRKLWIRTALWYDIDGNRMAGRKFIPVTVERVEPGTMVFPLRLTLSDESGLTFIQYMNIGNGSNESRSFAKLFRLSDPRTSYPAISDENWALIQKGKIRLGMTKEECRLSLGNPTSTDSGHDYSSTIDIWKYEDGTFLRFQDGLLIDLMK